MYTMAVQLRNH